MSPFELFTRFSTPEILSPSSPTPSFEVRSVIAPFSASPTTLNASETVEVTPPDALATAVPAVFADVAVFAVVVVDGAFVFAPDFRLRLEAAACDPRSPTARAGDPDAESVRWSCCVSWWRQRDQFRA